MDDYLPFKMSEFQKKKNEFYIHFGESSRKIVEFGFEYAFSLNALFLCISEDLFKKKCTLEYFFPFVRYTISLSIFI